MADIEAMVGKVINAVQKDPDILSELQSDPAKAISSVIGDSLDADTMSSLLSGLVGKSGATGSDADNLMSSLMGDGGGTALTSLLGGLTGQDSSEENSASDAGAAASASSGDILNDLTGGDGKIDAGDILNVAEDLLGGKK